MTEKQTEPTEQNKSEIETKIADNLKFVVTSPQVFYLKVQELLDLVPPKTNKWVWVAEQLNTIARLAPSPRSTLWTRRSILKEYSRLYRLLLRNREENSVDSSTSNPDQNNPIAKVPETPNGYSEVTYETSEYALKSSLTQQKDDTISIWLRYRGQNAATLARLYNELVVHLHSLDVSHVSRAVRRGPGRPKKSEG